MPSLLQGLEDIPEKLGTGNAEWTKTPVGGFYRRGCTWWVGSCTAEAGPALTAQRHGRSINAPSACKSSVAFPTDLSLVCLFSVSQNTHTHRSHGRDAQRGVPSPPLS